MRQQLDLMVLNGYLQRLTGAESIEALGNLAIEIGSEQGFEKICYGLLLPVSPTRPPRVVTLGNWPTELHDYYLGIDFFHFDPGVEAVFRGVVATTSDKLDYEASPERRAFRQQLLSFGVRGGVHFGSLVPGAEVSCMSFTIDRDPKRIKREMEHLLPFMHLLFAHIHQLATCLARADIQQAGEPLSPRELECLKWTAEGKTAAEIGLILNLSENTVIRHLANACRKLGAVNRTQAVAKAIIGSVIAPI